jgi:hypothetical protein
VSPSVERLRCGRLFAGGCRSSRVGRQRILDCAKKSNGGTVGDTDVTDTRNVNPGQAGPPSIWAPTWPWTVGIILAVVLFVIAQVSSGYNPARSLVAVLGGALGGAIGSILSSLVSLIKSKGEWFAAILPTVGFIVGLLSSEGVSVSATSFLNEEYVLQATLALLVGALCGLWPQLRLKKLSPTFANAAFWICCLIGVFGGALLSIPGALLLAYIGRRRYRQSART